MTQEPQPNSTEPSRGGAPGRPEHDSQYLKAAVASDRFCRYRKTYYLSTILLMLLLALFAYLAWRMLFRRNPAPVGAGPQTPGQPAPATSVPVTGPTETAEAIGDISVTELLAAI